MNKAKAARMSRDLKFGFVGIGLGSDFTRDGLIHRTVQIPKKYQNKNAMKARVDRYFGQW